ncbi:MAG: FadR/GntR family transcriptional regulator [Nakamurella sp.]
MIGRVALGENPTARELTDFLQVELISGQLAAGEKLPSERTLAARFGVSRPTVREVLRTLEQQGLIEVLAGRGTFLRAPTATDSTRPMDVLYRRRNATAREVNDARLMLETHGAALAAASATREEIAALGRTLAAFDGATTLVNRASQDIAFHLQIARASRNVVIESMFLSICGLAFELMLRSLADPAVYNEGGPLHHNILHAISAGDAAAAALAMREHLSVAERRFGVDLDVSLDLLARRELERSLGPSASLDAVLEAALNLATEGQAEQPWYR